MNEQNHDKPAVQKIISHGCLHRLQIDLMDYTLRPDGKWTWILQIKDHFSRMVWLFPLLAKDADPITDIMEVFYDDNGYPVIQQMDHGTEFKKRLNDVLAERGTIVIHGAPRHPQAQGSVEVANKAFKAILRKFQTKYGTTQFECFLKPI
jgi:transposase InsO family protein